MFMLKPADGVIGAQQQAIRSCFEAFRSLVCKIVDKLDGGTEER